MPPTFTAGVRDSLSNLAASLNAGRDKAASDGFVLFDLDRGQIESMYRGDWLARKVVDIVPYDMVREWREWSGHREDVVRVEAAERRLGLRKAVQRALVLGRLYGGGAIIIGTGETDPAALARPLEPDALPRGGLKFLHAVSRWQLAAPAIDRDPLSPWFGEAVAYDVVAPERGSLRLHPSRVVRFLGNAWPDPSLGASVWSDSVLLALYDAVHAVALTTAGATSLMHEAKVDVVTVPNLSEHLSSADTTAQLSARFAYAAAMKSINNLLLLGDGETWARQRIDFAGLPEMVRTFLQVAAGAADIGRDRPLFAQLRVPTTVAARRLGQGRAGAVEGASDGRLCGARAVARGGDGAARRGAAHRGRGLSECRGHLRRRGADGCDRRGRPKWRRRERPGRGLLSRSAPRYGWTMDGGGRGLDHSGRVSLRKGAAQEKTGKETEGAGEGKREREGSGGPSWRPRRAGRSEDRRARGSVTTAANRSPATGSDLGAPVLGAGPFT